LGQLQRRRTGLRWQGEGLTQEGPRGIPGSGAAPPHPDDVPVPPLLWPGSAIHQVGDVGQVAGVWAQSWFGAFALGVHEVGGAGREDQAGRVFPGPHRGDEAFEVGAVGGGYGLGHRRRIDAAVADVAGRKAVEDVAEQALAPEARRRGDLGDGGGLDGEPSRAACGARGVMVPPGSTAVGYMIQAFAVPGVASTEPLPPVTNPTAMYRSMIRFSRSPAQRG
jgi:hypothetical protein